MEVSVMQVLPQQALIKRFIGWAFGCSWLIAGILIIAYQQALIEQWGWLHYLVPWGVGIVGLWFGRQINTMPSLLRQLQPTRQQWPWIGVAFGLPVGLFGLACLVQWQITAVWPDWKQLGQVDYLGQVGLIGVWLLWLLSYGLAEELGWRGVLLPLLRQDWSPLRATTFLAGIWFCWHLPFWFYKDTYMQMGWAGLPMLAISLLASAFVFTWLAEKGGLLSAVVFHTTFDYFSASTASNGLINGFMSSGIWLLAGIIAWNYRHSNSSSFV